MRPWLYRIARNRSLNHLRRAQAIGVDSMDVHLSEHGTTTADKVHKREEFRQLMADVQELPETQRTALLLREIDALSYDQIAEAMETTVPSIKSLLVRARVSLAEAAEARLLTCDEVREELGEVAEGLQAHDRAGPPPPAPCDRCVAFRKSLRETNKALAAIFPSARCSCSRSSSSPTSARPPAPAAARPPRRGARRGRRGRRRRGVGGHQRRRLEGRRHHRRRGDRHRRRGRGRPRPPPRTARCVTPAAAAAAATVVGLARRRSPSHPLPARGPGRAEPEEGARSPTEEGHGDAEKAAERDAAPDHGHADARLPPRRRPRSRSRTPRRCRRSSPASRLGRPRASPPPAAPPRRPRSPTTTPPPPPPPRPPAARRRRHAPARPPTRRRRRARPPCDRRPPRIRRRRRPRPGDPAP